jgi:hypothetical protein
MKMKLPPKLAIPIAAAAVMAAATPGVAMAMTAAPAKTAVNARTEQQAAPAILGPWTEYMPPTDSPTQAKCNSVGQGLNVATFKCHEYEFDGYTTVWNLWFRIG